MINQHEGVWDVYLLNFSGRYEVTGSVSIQSASSLQEFMFSKEARNGGYTKSISLIFLIILDR